MTYYARLDVSLEQTSVCVVDDCAALVLERRVGDGSRGDRRSLPSRAKSSGRLASACASGPIFVSRPCISLPRHIVTARDIDRSPPGPTGAPFSRSSEVRDVISQKATLAPRRPYRKRCLKSWMVRCRPSASGTLGA
jgi:hypothetical protein